MKYYTIGKLAKLVRQTAVTIRYYEKIGLLPKSKRSEGGFRLYPESIIPRFYFIQNAKFIGFDLTEIKNLLDLEMNQSSTRLIKREMQQKIAHIETKLKNLNSQKENQKKRNGFETCLKIQNALSSKHSIIVQRTFGSI